jgi:quercetin dioxygenase-like cupin family protein
MSSSTAPRQSHFDPASFSWSDVEPRAYKEAEAGAARGMEWTGLTRHSLVRAEETGVSFEQRYFEIAPGGYSSFEKHAHVHVVVTLRGAGAAVIGDELVEMTPFGLVETPPWAPHRWVNTGEEPFGFLCTVEGDRDRPQPLSDEEWEALAADPRTAPYVH